jgi:hypothetical protein
MSIFSINTLTKSFQQSAPAVGSKWAYLKGKLLSFGKIIPVLLISLMFVGCEAYTITFLDENDNEIAVVNTNRSIIDLPIAPHKEGYTFIGWQEVGGSRTITPLVLSYEPPTLIMTFKAHYISNLPAAYTAVFLDDDGAKITTLKAPPSSSITTPAAPVKAHHTFIGYQEVGKSGTVANGASYALTKDIIFQARYTLNAGYHKVSFYDANLELLGSDTIAAGSVINLSEKASSFGVANWYRAKETNPKSGTFTPQSSINFYAAANVVEITDQAGLNNIRDTLSGKYILTNDIALNSNGAGFDANGWRSIGGYPDSAFIGIFNGNGHIIGNLWIDRPSTDYIGLFGYTKDSAIKNLGILSGGIEGNIAVGGIAGEIYNSTIANSYTAGSVKGEYDVGGIVGYANGSVAGSYLIGSVSGDSYVGGIAGVIYGGVTNAYSIGSIHGAYMCVGGIAGAIYSGNIANSYSAGNITGEGTIGGIAGTVYSSNITNSYSTVNINGGEIDGAIGVEAGGIAGEVLHESAITNSYSTGIISGIFDIGGIAGTVGSFYGVRSTPIIANNAAINQIVQGLGRTNRILGYIDVDIGEVKNNFARKDMKGSFVDSDKVTHAGISKTESEFKSQLTYTNALGWRFGNNDANPWKISAGRNGGYPYLYWEE